MKRGAVLANEHDGYAPGWISFKDVADAHRFVARVGARLSDDIRRIFPYTVP